MSLLETLLEPTARNTAFATPKSSPTGSPVASKLLGAPYFPAAAQLPRRADGSYWAFMAQINFADIPAGVDKDLPASGVLQLYFASNSSMGIDWQSYGLNGSGFLTAFWPDANADNHDASAASRVSSDQGYDLDLFPLDQSHEMEFKMGRQTVLPTDTATLDRMAGFQEQVEKIGPHAEEDWYSAENGPFTQVGGYAYFTQSDPRDSNEDWVILMQLDTDDRFGMMWGDCGVANLSIPRSALRERDFSKSYFAWDCC